jgi:integrase/recombinase XerD
MDVTAMTYRAWERGFGRPKPARIPAIAAFLGISPAAVLAALEGADEWPEDEPPASDPEPPRPSGGVDAFELFRAWWADIPTRHGPTTCKQYRREVFATCADLGRHPVTVTARDLERHLGELRPQYASLRRSALADFYRFLERRGYRPDNPLEQIPSPKIGRNRIRRGLSEEEMFRLWNAALLLGSRGGTKGLAGEGLSWAILAQYGLCLRPGELVNLTKSRVKLNGTRSYVEVTETKNGNDRIVPVVGIARTALEALVELSPPTSNRLIHIGTTRYWELIHGAAQIAGLPPEKCRPYALRHTGATRLAERGVHPRLIAEILGHTDLRAMWTYTQPGDPDILEALRKLSE